MNKNKPFIVVIVGPTASGKTELSIELAKRINGEIISGDSMQVYKHMNIGTAKVTPEEMDGIPHHLIDILNPDDTFSAYEFKRLAEDLITDITNRGKVPIIAGGTGLYIQSLIYNYELEDETVTPAQLSIVKQKLSALEHLDNQQLHDYLAQFDAVSAENIHPNNRQRVLRAIEYYLKTKKLLSNRKKVQQLVEQGYESCQSMQAIGYKELIPVINGQMIYEDAVNDLKQHSRQYAKRQMTWFKNKMSVHWLDKDNMSLQMMLDEITTQIK
ncbi:TPA: tRNA (adenosine(37)-N6)-dimethylallyltransferase MiaA [Staphylococcus aureus]